MITNGLNEEDSQDKSSASADELMWHYLGITDNSQINRVKNLNELMGGSQTREQLWTIDEIKKPKKIETNSRLFKPTMYEKIRLEVNSNNNIERFENDNKQKTIKENIANNKG